MVTSPLSSSTTITTTPTINPHQHDTVMMTVEPIMNSANINTSTIQQQQQQQESHHHQMDEVNEEHDKKDDVVQVPMSYNNNNNNSNFQQQNKKKVVRSGRWSPTEHQRFLEGLRLYGRDWNQVTALVGTRTGRQVRSHNQKYETALKTRSSSSMKEEEKEEDDDEDEWEDDGE